MVSHAEVRRFAVLALAFGLVACRASHGGAFGWFDSNPVAKKVAEFRESQDFVVGGFDFTGDGMELATNGQETRPEVHLWSWRTPSRIARVLQLPTGAGSGEAIRCSPDGTLLAVGHTYDRQHTLVRVWRTDTWAVARDIEDSVGAFDQMGLAFSPDGKFLARTASRLAPGPDLILYRTDTWEVAWSLGTRPFRANTLALSPDGKYAAIAGFRVVSLQISHPEILIIDLSNHQTIRTIAAAFPDNNEIQTLAWSPDGKALAAGALVTESAPGPDAVRIFDPATGQPITREAAKVAYVSGLRYSPDGRYLVDAYLDGEVHIWDGQHKQLLQVIPVNLHFHTAVSISRDSRHLAIAAGRDVSVWELK
jgi:WD40 repeat protein